MARSLFPARSTSPRDSACNNRGAIFFGEDDYARYGGWLAEAANGYPPRPRRCLHDQSCPSAGNMRSFVGSALRLGLNSGTIFVVRVDPRRRSSYLMKHRGDC